MDESDENTSAGSSDVEANQAVFQADNVDDAVDSDVEANRAFFESNYIDYYVEMDDVSRDVEANRNVFPTAYVGDAVDSDVEANRDIFPASYVGDSDDSDVVEANRDIFPAAYFGDGVVEGEGVDYYVEMVDNDELADNALEIASTSTDDDDVVEGEGINYIVEMLDDDDDVVEVEGVDYYVEMVDDDDDELANDAHEISSTCTDDDDSNDVADEPGNIIAEEIENADGNAVEDEIAGEATQEPVVEGRSSATGTDDDFGGVIGVRDSFCLRHCPYPFVNKSVWWDLEAPKNVGFKKYDSENVDRQLKVAFDVNHFKQFMDHGIMSLMSNEEAYARLTEHLQGLNPRESKFQYTMRGMEAAANDFSTSVYLLDKYWSSRGLDRAPANHLLGMHYANTAHKFALKMNWKMDAVVFAWNPSLTLSKFNKEVQKVLAAVAYGRDTPVLIYEKLSDEKRRWDLCINSFWEQFTKSQRLTHDASSWGILLQSGIKASKVPFCFDGGDPMQHHEPFRQATHSIPPKLSSHVTKQPLGMRILLACCQMAKRIAKG